MKTPSPVETQLLALIAHGELPGREIARRYREETGKSISYGTLYTTFGRMRDSGWVTSRDSEDEDGRIRYFKMTGTGAHALNEARAYYQSIANFGGAILGIV